MYMDIQSKHTKLSPTPIEKLSFSLNQNEFYIKRDDLLPFSFGGNKARKAEYFFDVILTGGYDTVVTYGSSSSNHCRVIANLAAKYSLSCYIITPEEAYHETANSKMISLFDAKVVKAPLGQIKEAINNLMNQLSENHKPYFIQGGGHGNLGTQAYVDAYREICDYEGEKMIHFDYIFLASGTGTTQAGLICGAALAGHCERKIIGISIARANPYGRDVVVDSVEDYLSHIPYLGNKPEIIFDDAYIAGGYGCYHQEILDTANRCLIYDGIPLNTTYTGKAFWGMIEYIKKNIVQGKKILFLHTGGTPLFFDGLTTI